MRLFAIFFMVVAFSGCASNGPSREDQFFIDQGTQLPDLWCRSFLDLRYLDLSNDQALQAYVIPRLYLWKIEELNQDTMGVPGRPYIQARYYMDGAFDRWDWDSHSLIIAPSGLAYYVSANLSNEDMATVEPEYECCAYTGRYPVCGP